MSKIKGNSTLTAELEFQRTLKGYKKLELANNINLHPNTYRKREVNPLSFTLEELIQLKKAFNTKTIDEIFNLNNERGKECAQKSGD